MSLGQAKGARFALYSTDWRALGEMYRGVLTRVRGTQIDAILRPG